MHALMHTSKILPVEIVAQMKAERLGLSRDSGAGLTSHSHGGYHPGAMKRQRRRAIFTFSNGLTVGLIVNSILKVKVTDEVVHAMRDADQAIAKKKS